jgi:hypothetical protein
MRTLGKMRADNVPAQVDLSRSAICQADQLALLSAAVMCNTTVRRLVLDYNRLGAAGATQLAAGLAVNTTLTSLGIKGTEVGPVGLAALVTALKSNETLTEIGVDEMGSVPLRRLVNLNASLVRVREGAAALSAAVPHEDDKEDTPAEGVLPMQRDQFNAMVRLLIVDAARIGKYRCAEDACQLVQFIDYQTVKAEDHYVGPAALLLQHNEPSVIGPLAAVLRAGFDLGLAVRNLVSSAQIRCTGGGGRGAIS